MKEKDIKELNEAGKVFAEKFSAIAVGLMDSLTKINPEEAKKVRDSIGEVDIMRKVQEVNSEFLGVKEKLDNLNGAQNNR